MKTPVFKGSCTAIVTPFEKGGIDYERLKKNLDFQYENGTAAVVVCGTTGENATLSEDEYQELVHAAICANCGKPTQVPFLPREDRPVYCSECFAAMQRR